MSLNITKMDTAIAAFARGEFLIVSDNEDRENEGDLIVAAEHATPEAVNFMITAGKGLVCVAITPEIAGRYSLYPMANRNDDPMQTAFTVSVDAAPEFGVTTGISTFDRAKTIELLISDEPIANGLCSPGHMFPLVAKEGGVLERPGHTEAAVELAMLAGLKPAGVIVEIINADGTMARRPQLEALARQHSLHYITIEELIEYVNYKTMRVTQRNSERRALYATVGEQT